MKACALATRRGLESLAALVAVSLSLTACSGIFRSAGPTVILVPALTVNHEPYQLAEDVRAYIFVELQDGSVVRSKNRVKIRAGTWCDEVEPLKTKPEGGP